MFATSRNLVHFTWINVCGFSEENMKTANFYPRELLSTYAIYEQDFDVWFMFDFFVV